ncbi:MAG TPA: penicillin-binding protein 2 [Acidimicrobiia bacterium]|nr:penicillin-binding protein 2 [Acidimicrobiia bacterium]
MDYDVAPRRFLDVRLVGVIVVLVLAWGGMGFRLWVVQAAQAEEFAEKGLSQRLQREVLAADRGTIFDRDGRELAVTVDATTVYANPLEIADPDAAARTLAPLLGKSPVDLARKMSEDASFVYLARQLDREVGELVREADITGVYLLDEPRRTYPLADVAAHVVGFVRTDDNAGLEGLEAYYDAELTGTPGELLVERDPYGRTIPQGEYSVVPAQPGADLVLTIKAEIQYAAHQALVGALGRTGAASGSIVVLDAASGDVLAMVNLPTFDPNDRSDLTPEAVRNRAVTDLFEPGSTQMLVSVAGALLDELVRPHTTFDIPRRIEILDTVFEDITVHPDALTVTEIVAYSSNLGTILLAEELGIRSLHQWLFSFGEGSPTGIDFPGEAGGVLRAPEDWCATTCLAGTSIGYHVSVTPLQMAMAYAIVANDGRWVQPHLVDEIVDGAGVRSAVRPLERRVLSEQTSSQLRIMLEAVVEEGTGGLASVPGYRVGGKTGTTRKFIAETGAYSEDDVVASFVGMAPIEDPQIIVAVVLDTPQEDASGGKGAAPVFAEVMRAALNQLGVPPDGR